MIATTIISSINVKPVSFLGQRSERASFFMQVFPARCQSRDSSIVHGSPEPREAAQLERLSTELLLRRGSAPSGAAVGGCTLANESGGARREGVEPSLFAREVITMRASIVLTVIGPDRPGIVELLSTTIAAHGGNWEQSRMAHAS
jgi:hypothetical protein